MAMKPTFSGSLRGLWDVSPGRAGTARGCGRSMMSSSSIRRAAGLAVVMTVLVACGSARPASGDAAWSADGSSFGVDSTSWPGSLEDAREVLAEMPEELGGEAPQLMLPGGPDEDEVEEAVSGVFYGDERNVLVSDDSLADGAGVPEGAGAQASLAAMFGLVYSCDPDTYEGTIKPHPEFSAPGFSEVDGTTPAWFSCRIDAAEGAEDFSAQAVGWTSAKTAWLIVGPDDAAVRELVTALHQAKG
jgi:hypothetical protein